MTARDWALIRKYLVANYNVKVNNYFTSNPNTDLQTLCLIQSKDSALIAEMRMSLFHQQAKPTDNPYQLVEVSARFFDSCNGTTPVWKHRTVRCFKGQESHTVLTFENLADIKGQQTCNTGTCYAAVPEWWQIRLEGKRPQLVILFAEIDSNGNVVGSAKNPISIPHPIVQRQTTAPLPPYQKGQYEAMVTLNDNSKIIINAISAEVADSTLQAATKLVQPQYLEGAIYRPSAPRKGTELLQINVKAVRGEYFSTGLKNVQPDWVDIYS